MRLEGGMFKCGSKKCKVCENVIVGSTFKRFVRGRTFHINHHSDCNSEGVVYWSIAVVVVSTKQYVGCTITP